MNGEAGLEDLAGPHSMGSKAELTEGAVGGLRLWWALLDMGEREEASKQLQQASEG